MGALADRCPRCGVFLRKGARSCKRCDWEPELFTEASDPGAFRRGLLLGLLAGAGSTLILALLLGLVLR